MNTILNFILTIVIVGIAIFVLLKFLSKNLIKEIKTLFLLFVNGKKTWGYIKVVDDKTHIEGSTIYSAGIEFIRESNKPIFFKTPYDLMARPNVGARIDVVYDPNDPTIARVYSLGTFLVPVFSLLSIILGIGAIVFAIVKLEVLKL